MKRLALLSAGVFLALAGFIAILYFLPREEHEHGHDEHASVEVHHYRKHCGPEEGMCRHHGEGLPAGHPQCGHHTTDGHGGKISGGKHHGEGMGCRHGGCCCCAGMMHGKHHPGGRDSVVIKIEKDTVIRRGP